MQDDINLKDAQYLIMCILRIQYLDDSKRVANKEPILESLHPETTGIEAEPSHSTQLVIKSEDIPRFQKAFNIFYLNRLQFMGKILEDNKQQKAKNQEYQFKPQLNHNSSAIAAKYRQKIAEGKGIPAEIDPNSNNPDKINTFEWLADGAVYKEVWREHARKIVEEERMKECTFKPLRVAAHSTVNLGIARVRQ